MFAIEYIVSRNKVQQKIKEQNTLITFTLKSHKNKEIKREPEQSQPT